jgi:fatty-acyl-CoA synthase
VPVAYVIARADATVTTAELEAFCRDQLARYKVPRDIVFVDSLPRNAMGKVQHFRLRELAGGGVASGESRTPAGIAQTHPPQRPWRWPFGAKR